MAMPIHEKISPFIRGSEVKLCRSGIIFILLCQYFFFVKTNSNEDDKDDEGHEIGPIHRKNPVPTEEAEADEE